MKDSAAVLAAECAARDLGLAPFALTRQAQGSTSAVFTGGTRVLIVAPPYADPAALAARVTLAALLARTGRFVVPVWPEPRRFADRLVTAWERVEIGPGPMDWHSAGTALRRLHDLPPGEITARLPLPDVSGLADVRAAIAGLVDTGGCTTSVGRLLDRIATRLGDELRDLDQRQAIVHGDLHAPNLLNGRGGVVLCDTDEIAVGAPAYDLGVLMDPARPAIPDAAVPDFTEGYGAPLPPVAARRSFARAAHLRRTVALLSRRNESAHERFYDRVRLGAWAAMDRRWSADLVPVVTLSAPRRVWLAARQPR